MKKHVCVFCGSRQGSNPDWSEWAEAFGGHIAVLGHTLIFGGGAGGLMGKVAQGAINQGGEVVGIIPEQLIEKEGLVKDLSEVHYVQTMSERKEWMSKLAHAFVILPGGIGTLDEFSEVWTNAQIGFHSKPIILVNWSGYYDHLLYFLESCAKNGMMTDAHFEKIQIVDTPEDLYGALIALTDSI